jgi:hypothetical protein
MTRKARPRVARGPQPRLLSSPYEEKLLRMVMTLATELAVTRERTDALETACRNAGIDVNAVLEDASEATVADRLERHRELAGRLLQILDEPP